MRVVIVGGGIGGLALAVSLHDAGLTDVELLESAPVFAELGVGINLLPHAVRELTELGLLPPLEALAVRTGELVLCNRFGQRIWIEPRGLAAGYAWPQLSIHRGALLGVLHSTARERLGEDHLHPGVSVRRVEVAEDHARALCADGREVRGDVVVACDGVHSVVRSQLNPGEGPPRWNGVTMWRGMTWAPPFLTGRSMVVAGHSARRIVIYPIGGDGSRARVNWVGEVKTADGRPMPKQDWDHSVDRDEVAAHFADFALEWLDVPALIDRADQVYQYPMVDRDPLPRWGSGRLTLLGDAAHPMYPIGSNGASQAILDARVLARELALGDSVPAALEAYEAQRRPATAAVVLANRKVGPERAMEIVHERAPDGFDRIEDVITQAELEAISSEYRRVAGFDPQLLAERASLSVR